MNICVYCGSSPGKNPVIIEKARVFGRRIAEQNHTLIYGGSSLGVMGALADSVMINNGDVIGVIPENLFSREVAHRGITRLITVRDMHQRKSHMAELADAFVAMPGGFGTMEELFEIITWNQIGILEKPVTVLNLEDYFDPLIQMIDRAVGAGYIKPKNREILQVADSVEECLLLCTNS